MRAEQSCRQYMGTYSVRNTLVGILEAAVGHVVAKMYHPLEGRPHRTKVVRTAAYLGILYQKFCGNKRKFKMGEQVAELHQSVKANEFDSH